MIVVAKTLDGHGRTPCERMLRANGDDIVLAIKQPGTQIRHRKLWNGDCQVNLSTCQSLGEALDDRWRNSYSDMSRFVPQYLYERDEQSLLHVIILEMLKVALALAGSNTSRATRRWLSASNCFNGAASACARGVANRPRCVRTNSGSPKRSRRRVNMPLIVGCV